MTSKTRKRKQQADDSEDDFDEDAYIGKASCKRKVSEVGKRKVDETLEKLREKHGNLFTQMQYRIRSE